MITLTASASYGYGGKQFVARITGRDPKMTFARTFLGSRGGKRNESTSADVDEPGLYEIRDIDRKGGKDDSYWVVLETEAGGLRKVSVDKEEAMKIAKALDGRPFGEVVVPVTPVAASPLWAARNARAVHAERLAQGEGKDPEEIISVRGNPEMEHLGGPQGDSNWGKCPRRVLREFRAAAIVRLDAEIAALEAAGAPVVAPVTASYTLLTSAAAAKRTTAQTVEAATETCWAALASLPDKQRKQVLVALKGRMAPEKLALVSTGINVALDEDRP